MTITTYSTYQESRIPWVPEVPSHWTLTQVRREAKYQTGGTPPTGNDSLYDGDRTWVTIGDLKGRVCTESAKKITADTAESLNIPISPKGSLLFSFKLSVGQVAFAGDDVYTNEAIATFLPESRISLAYAYYAFPLYIVQNASENIYGAKLLNRSLIQSAPLPLPPRDEQTAIAAFLDHETGRIDGLIAEQERLIALLDEKRQAVISHTVTKGLDPDVEMKDSGIEWLGEVPVHWEIVRIREAASLMNGYPFDSNKFSQDAGHPLIRIRDLNCKHTALLYDGDFIDAAKVDGNDLLIGMDGDFNVGRWKGQGEALLNQRVCCLRGNTAIVRWLEYVIPYPLKLINDVTYSTTVKHLSSGQVLDIRIPMPRGNEMGALLDHLDKAVGRLDNLTSTAKEGIKLLKERRSALISATVTGKIDVRNHPAVVAALNENKD